MAIKTTLRFCSLLVVLCGLNLQAAAPFWGETFLSGIPGNWTTGDSPSNSKLWQHCDNFTECPPGNFSSQFFKDERFESFSADNGFAYLMPYGTTASGVPHDTWLQTDVINCEDKDKVFLKFTTYIAARYTAPETDAVVEVQTGGGAWVEYVIFRNLHPDLVQTTGTALLSYQPQVVWLDLTAQAKNQSQVRIRWRWQFTGNTEYCWLLDDVELFDENPLHEHAVWGTLPGQGDFAGGWNGWTVAFGNDTCRWRWSDSALVDFPDSGTLADGFGSSPTLSNGVAVVNPTFCKNFNEPFNLQFTHTSLTSPGINLSGIAAGTKLSLQFHQTVRTGNEAFSNLPVTGVAISADGGATFIDTLDANPLLPFDKDWCGMRTLDLPLETAGSANVKIRFLFYGDAFYWMVDDVRILKRFDNDLRVNRQFSAVAPSFAVPRDQVMPLRFIAEVENGGNAAQDFSTLFLTVQDVETEEEVHWDTLFLGTLAPGAVISTLPFPKTFTPPAKTARYACFYKVKADLPDEDLTNNSVRWTFEVTDSIFGKARSLNAVPVFSYFDPIFGQPFEVGNCYFIPPNPGKQWASSVSFAFVGASDLPPAGMELQVALYKWKTASGFGDVNGDTLANADEFEQVTFTNATVELTDYRKLITVPLDPNGEWQPFELEDSTYYFVTVANPSSNYPMRIAASEEVDYTAMFWLSYQFNLPMFVSMLRMVGEPDFIANAWALRRIPFIRLNMVNLTPGEEVKTEPLALEIQPNPASGEFFLTVENGKMQRQARVEIFDAAGQLQAVFEFKNTIVSQLPIPVESLRNGFYFVKVTTEAGIGTQKLAVFRE